MCPLAPYDTLCLWINKFIHSIIFHPCSRGQKKSQKSNLFGCPHCKRLCWDWFGAIVAQHVVKLFRITVLLYGRLFPGRKSKISCRSTWMPQFVATSWGGEFERIVIQLTVEILPFFKALLVACFEVSHMPATHTWSLKMVTSNCNHIFKH